jgi:hypothetical protein
MNSGDINNNNNNNNNNNQLQQQGQPIRDHYTIFLQCKSKFSFNL